MHTCLFSPLDAMVLTVYLDYHRFMNKWFGFWKWTLIFCLIFQVSMVDGSFVTRNANFDISSFDKFLFVFVLISKNESAIFQDQMKLFEPILVQKRHNYQIKCQSSQKQLCDQLFEFYCFQPKIWVLTSADCSSKTSLTWEFFLHHEV